MNKIIEKAKITHDLNKDEILELLQNDDINEELFKAADEVRQKYLGDYVHLRGLIEFTNICKEIAFIVVYAETIKILKDID